MFYVILLSEILRKLSRSNNFSWVIHSLIAFRKSPRTISVDYKLSITSIRKTVYVAHEFCNKIHVLRVHVFFNTI